MEATKSNFTYHAAALRIQIMKLVRRLRVESEQASEGLPFSQISLIGAIARHGKEATPSALAKAEGLRSSNLATLLRRLEEGGYVMRKADTNDKRAKRIALTEHGHDVLQKNRLKREQWLVENIQQHLSDRERAILFEAGQIIERLASC